MESSNPHSEVQPSPVADPLVGRTLNERFKILEAVGAGGMGKVYKAIQSPLDRVVALKVLNPSFPAERDPAFKKRFLLEANMTSRLRHPNTVTVIDYGQTDDGIFYIAMELLEGRTLGEVVAREKTLPWQRVLDIGQQISRSLREAHNLGVVHRDLKPANVMLLNEAGHDVVKVLDFGLVKSFQLDPGQIDPEVTQNGMFLGSPQYMAPEQARNIADPRSDVYSLGVLLYQMLTGRPPFVGKDYLDVIFMHMKETPRPLRLLRPDLDIPADVETAVLKCLAKDPAQRYQSMDELLDALRYAGMVNGMSGSGIFSALRPGMGLPPTPPPMGQPGSGPVSRPVSQPLLTPPRPPADADDSGPTERQPTALRGDTGPRGRDRAETLLDTGDEANTMAIDISVAAEQAPRATPKRVLNAARRTPAPAPSTARRGVLVAVLVGTVLAALVFTVINVLGTQSSGSKKREVTPAPVASVPSSLSPEPEPTAQTVAPKAAVAGVVKKAELPHVRFHVSSDPEGAQVFLGHHEVGLTPTLFELPARADGTATAELVFVLDGYPPQSATAGGSGDVLLTQKLQKRVVVHVPSPAVYRGRDDEEPKDTPIPIPVASAPNVSVPVASTGSVAVSRPAAAPVTAPARATTPSPVRASLPATGGSSAPLNFGEGMTRPEQIGEGKGIIYSREAIASHSGGVMVVRCLITVGGTLENCRTLKAVPFMESAVIESLKSRRYKPVTLNGQPIAVDYVFTLKLAPP